MNRVAVAGMVSALVSMGCAMSRERASGRLQSAVDNTVARADQVDHAVLRVDAPQAGLQEVFVAGEGADGLPFTPDTPFLSASVGKLFVAATLADMADDNLLSLDDPVSKWVDASVLDGLPAMGGVAAFDTITVGMLLRHRSGLPDYFDGEVHPTSDGAPDVFSKVRSQPGEAWDRDRALDYTRAHWTPYAAPDTAFLYSDLNYDLAGLVIEGVTKAPWHASVRTRVLDPLRLQSTWVHQFEDPPAGVGAVAPAKAGDVVITGTPALGVDGAGGGLFTTTGDLVRFMRGLERGEPVSLDVLGTAWTPDAIHRGIDYGHGVWRVRPGGMFFLMAGLPTLRGVSGVTGSYVYLLGDGTVVAGTFDQTDFADDHIRFLLAEVVPTLARLEATPDP